MCNKKAFSKRAAEHLVKTWKGSKKKMRIYFHNVCRAWHVTTDTSNGRFYD